MHWKNRTMQRTEIMELRREKRLLAMLASQTPADHTKPRYEVTPHQFWQKKSDAIPGPKQISLYGSLPPNREAYEIVEKGYSIYDRRSGTHSNYFFGKVGIETQAEGEQIVERLLNVKAKPAPTREEVKNAYRSACVMALGSVSDLDTILDAGDGGDPEFFKAQIVAAKANADAAQELVIETWNALTTHYDF